MTPLKMLQTSPDRANALFARLADTTNGAVKTRERLFEELKGEIELLARLEHDHLLPVLKKHAGTKTIVAETGERIRELNAMLRRLEHAPKGDEAFLAGLTELKRAFQQHLRDEKGALLPKVQKALSDEEIETVAGRIENDRAEVEATVRHEAEVQRANARREREEARQAAAEAAEREARRIEREQRAAAEAAARVIREPVEQASQLAAAPFGAAVASAGVGIRETMEVFRSAAETTSTLATVAQTGMSMAQAAQEAGREWMRWAQQRTGNQTAAVTQLMQCRSPRDFMAVQESWLRQELQLFIDAGVRITRIAAATSQNAAGRLMPAPRG